MALERMKHCESVTALAKELGIAILFSSMACGASADHLVFPSQMWAIL